MTHAERATVKRCMGIGENKGENDLNANEFRIERFIVVHGNKYPIIETGDRYCAQVLPGRHAYGDSIEQLREAVIAALAEKAPAVPVPGSIAWVGIDWGVSPYMAARYLYNERQNDLYRRLMEVASNQIVPPYER